VAELLNFIIFCDVTSCGCVNIYRRLEIYKCCHLQGTEVKKDPESKQITFRNPGRYLYTQLCRPHDYTPSDKVLSGLRPSCSVPKTTYRLLH
jgi:hypothetical protein